MVRQERIGKAMKRLLSNGSAGNSEEVYEDMVNMHPKRKEPLKKHISTVPQVHVSTKQAKEYLYGLASQDQSSPGFFGWTGDLLLPMRGRKRAGWRTTFLQQMARLVARLANADVPPICGFIFTCGNLFALNKLNAEEQQDRVNKGLEPKRRPVNIGCSILKWAFKLDIRTPQARRTIAPLAPLQMGLGVERGPEVIAHMFRALYEQGYIILTTDFTNGFNSFLRQAMLDAVQKRCPALTAVFNMFYALDSMCFFSMEGETKIVWSKEGSRMGCVLGSFGFDITVEDIYEAVDEKYSEMKKKALTDDFTNDVRPPATAEEADNTWIMCGEAL